MGNNSSSVRISLEDGKAFAMNISSGSAEDLEKKILSVIKEYFSGRRRKARR